MSYSYMLHDYIFYSLVFISKNDDETFGDYMRIDNAKNIDAARKMFRERALQNIVMGIFSVRYSAHSKRMGNINNSSQNTDFAKSYG